MNDRFPKLMRLGVLLLALANLAVLAWLLVRRFGYPYDLEWMEGGMLCHSLRLLAGQPIYAPPSVDFIPFLYTPLYPALLAWLSHFAPGGLTYALGRAVSIVSLVGAMVLAWRFIARHGGSRVVALAAMAIPAAAFVLTGAWYDIARPDSLWLFLVVAGVLLIYIAARDREGHLRQGELAHMGAALAGALLVAAFFAKQTASPFMIAAGIGLIFLNWRLVPAYVLALACLGLPTLYLLNHASDGWFWTYVFKLHQSHSFFARRAYLETPWTLAKILGPALFIVPWGLMRRPSAGLFYATWLGLCGMLASCIAFGTQWAYLNAYIPGVFFPALAIGVAAGRLVTQPSAAKKHQPRPTLPRLRPAMVYFLLAVSLALHPFDPRPLVPTPEDRKAGDELVRRLREAKGDVLIPFHPFYAHLAGKPTFVHRMGLLDVGRAGMPTPKGLAEAIAAQRFSLAVFDDKIAGTWQYFPGMLSRYTISERLAGPMVVTGAATHPEFVLTPKQPDPEIDLDLQ